MKNRIRIAFSICCGLVLFAACTGRQSVQQYYVANASNPAFLAVDVPVNILKTETLEMGSDEQVALNSVRKLNILAFRKTESNEAEYQAERDKVKAILAGDGFQELMKLNSEFGRGSIQFTGDVDAIDEVIIFGDSQQNGFALIRVLGDNMNPADFMRLLQSLDSSQLEGMGDLSRFFKG